MSFRFVSLRAKVYIKQWRTSSNLFIMKYVNTWFIYTSTDFRSEPLKL